MPDFDRRRGETPNTTKASGPAVDRIIAQFWKSIYGPRGLPTGGTVLVSSHHRNRTNGAMHPKPGEFKFCATADELARYTMNKQHNQLDDSVFFSPAVLMDTKTVRKLGHNAKTKDNLFGLKCIWADIDYDKLDAMGGATPEEVITALEALPCPPSWIIMTGGGVHAYWVLRDWIVFEDEGSPSRAEMMADVDEALRQLAWLVGGDSPVAQAAAYLRVPGSVNWKRGRHQVLPFQKNAAAVARKREYEPDQIIDMLRRAEAPVLVRRSGGIVKAKRRVPEPDQDDPDTPAFIRHLREQHDFVERNARVAIEDSLKACDGTGAEMHEAIIRAAASLVSCGVTDVDQVTDYLIGKLQEQPYSRDWIWDGRDGERQKVRKATEGWLRHLQKIDDLPAHQIDINDFVDGGEEEGEDDDDGNEDGAAGAEAGPVRPGPARREARVRAQEVPKARDAGLGDDAGPEPSQARQEVDKKARPRPRAEPESGTGAEPDRGGAGAERPGAAEPAGSAAGPGPTGGRAQDAGREADERIVDFSKAKERRQAREAAMDEEDAPKAKPGPKGDKKFKHIACGIEVFEELIAFNRFFAIIDGNPWTYHNGLWRLSNAKAFEGWLNTRINRIVAKGKGKYPPTSHFISEVRRWMLVQDGIQFEKHEVEFDAHGLIAVRDPDGRTVLLEWRDGSIKVARPAERTDWCIKRIPMSFDPEKQDTRLFRQFLDTLFDDREPAAQERIVRFLITVMGCALLPRRSRYLRTAMHLIGNTETGKSQLLELVSAMLGDRLITTPLAELERDKHALASFIDGGTWVLHEAYEGNQKLGNVANMKALLTGDLVHANPKNQQPVSFRFDGSAWFGSNFDLGTRDDGDAVVGRTHTLHMTRVFDREVRVGVAIEAHEAGFEQPWRYVLAREESAILNALLAAGMAAWRAGHIADIPETEEARAEQRDEAGQLRACLREICDPNPDGRLASHDLACAVRGWWDQHGGAQKMPGRLLKRIEALANPKMICGDDLRTMKARHVAGVELTAAGLRFFAQGKEALQLEGKSVGTLSGHKDVNKPIPEIWNAYPSVRGMRKAHERAPDYLFTSRLDMKAIDMLRDAAVIDDD